MSSLEAAPKPLHVAPLIKFCRWTFLSLGIVYGLYHQRRFEKKEAALRELEIKNKPIRDAEIAEQKRRQAEAERQMIADFEKKT